MGAIVLVQKRRILAGAVLLTAALITAAQGAPLRFVDGPARAKSHSARMLPTPQALQQALGEMEARPYEMTAVRIALAPSVRRSTFVRDDTMGKRIAIAFSFWVLKDGPRVILIDTGFADPRWAQSWGIADHRDAVKGLKEIGIEPRQVTDVIITHQHWDHIGGIADFAAAHFWFTAAAHRATVRWAKRRAPKLARTLEVAEKEGRLTLARGVQQAMAGVLLVPLGIHTPGFQAVVVKSPDGTWVFASDIGPLKANFERVRPTGLAADHQRARAAIELLSRLVAGDLSRIIPGHEPEGFDPVGIHRLRVP